MRRAGTSDRTSDYPSYGYGSADRIQLQQVLLNLILNGVEAVSAVPDGARAGGQLGDRPARRSPGLRARYRNRLRKGGGGPPVRCLLHHQAQGGMGMGLAIGPSTTDAA